MHSLLIRAQQLLLELSTPEPGFAALCQCVFRVLN